LTESTSPGGTRAVTGRLLYRGAEADVILGRWQGLDAVFKVRKPLKYRLAELDDAIRRQRTLREAEMVHRAKAAGVETPFLYDVEPTEATLIMEFVEGDRMKDLVSSTPPGAIDEMFASFGVDIGRLHSAGMMHGDLTTANVVRRNGALVFIDFGLAIPTTRVEDHAVDLRLIKETLVGAHAAIAPRALEALFRGYSKSVGQSRSRAIMKQLQAIERRGRYARVA
jgi:TP53 regulating kinase-like protein